MTIFTKLAKILFCIGFAVLVINCGSDGPSLLSEHETGLPTSVYQTIADYEKATVAQKNAIMEAVKAAMEARPKGQAKRDSSINAAVNSNGGYSGFARAIKSQVDCADPIPVPTALLTLAKSGLPQNIYELIANRSSATVAEKNAIMFAVKTAMDVQPKDQSARDAAIAAAVAENGGGAGFAAAIKTQVDLADPIPLSSPPPPSSSPPASCSSAIANGVKAARMGECSGPYYLTNVEFYIVGRAVAVKLSGNVTGLPGSKSGQHVTVLHSAGGVTTADQLFAEQEYAKWQAARGRMGPVPFYLEYWTGGRSELIKGELKDLVDFIRSAAPAHKKPNREIHVELY